MCSPAIKNALIAPLSAFDPAAHFLISGKMNKKPATAPAVEGPASTDSADATATLARDRERRRARLAYGWDKTLVTGGAGATPPSNGLKSLLGS